MLTKKEIDEINDNFKWISLGSILFILLFSFFFHKYLVNHSHQGLSIFLVTVVPIVAILYNIYYKIRVYKNLNDREKELKEIKIEIKAESKFYEIIAVMLFGLGLIYAEFKTYKYLSIVFPYLLFALLFGSIFTSWFKQFVFDYNNLERLLTVDLLTFCSSALAVGLLISGLLVPIIYHSRNNKGSI